MSGDGYFVGAVHQAPDHRLRAAGYSPVALAAWMVDHDTDAYYKIAGAFTDDKPSGNLTRDHILDNVTTYWLTGTGASAARSYREAYGPDAPAAGQKPLPASSIPFGFTTFPGEIWRTPRSWVEASYPNVVYFNEVDKGGHFAAWEEPSSSARRCARRSSRCAERSRLLRSTQPPRSARSASRSRRSRSTTSAAVSRRRGGPPPSSSRTPRRASSSRSPGARAVLGRGRRPRRLEIWIAVSSTEPNGARDPGPAPVEEPGGSLARVAP